MMQDHPGLAPNRADAIRALLSSALAAEGVWPHASPWPSLSETEDTSEDQ
jgi:hypothetical protein